MKKNYFHDQSDHCGVDVIVTNNTNITTTANSHNEPYSPINAQLPSDCGSYGHAGNTATQSITISAGDNATKTPTTSSVATFQTLTYGAPQNDDAPSGKEQKLERDWPFILREVWGFPVTKAILLIAVIIIALRLFF